MEQIDVNAMKDQAKDFAKASAKGINSSLVTCLKKAFCFKGRATRMEYSGPSWSVVSSSTLPMSFWLGFCAGFCALPSSPPFWAQWGCSPISSLSSA